MKKILTILLCFSFLITKAQFNPSIHVVVNDAIGQSQAAPIEGRGMFWDQVNFRWRDFQSTAEVLSTLPTNPNRFSHFPIYVHSGGTLSGGVWTGGITLVYFFKDGLADGNLVRWYTDSVIVPKSVIYVKRLTDSTFFAARSDSTRDTVLIRGTAAGGIGSLTLNTPSSVFNSPVNFSNTGGAWNGILVLNNQGANTIFAGPTVGSPAQPAFRGLVTADLPSGIPNGNLANSSISFNFGTSGSSPNWSAASASLGGSITFNIPQANNVNSGYLTAFDWNRFNTVATSSVTSVNGQTGVTVVKNADSIKSLPVDTSAHRNNYVLAFDSTNHKWYLAAPSVGTGTVTNVSSGNIPSLASVSVSNPTTTPAFTFTLSSQSQNLLFASPNGSSGTPSFRSFVNADLPVSGVTAGTYNSLTVNAQGIVTAASNVGAGITSLNGLTAATQIFATGTSGTDFTIVSGTATHTFNLPIASGINTGKLLNTDWTTFNNKQGALTLTTTGTGAATLISNTLNIPNNFQSLSYTQNATNNNVALSLSNSINILPVTTSLAGLADTAMKHLSDSIHNRTLVFNLFTGNYGPTGLGILFGAGGDSIIGKRLQSGANVTLTQNPDSSITISATGASGISYTWANVANTSNYTITTSNALVLADLTGQANRNVVLPASPTGNQVSIIVDNSLNTSAFTWTFTNATVKDDLNNTVTTLSNATRYWINYDPVNTVYRITN